MSVEVPSFDEAAVVVRQFRSFDSIDVIKVSSMSKQEAEDGGAETVSFTVTCLYKIEQTTTVAVVEETTAEE